MLEKKIDRLCKPSVGRKYAVVFDKDDICCCRDRAQCCNLRSFFQQRYGHNPAELYHVVRHCLHQEMNLLQKPELVSALHRTVVQT